MPLTYLLTYLLISSLFMTEEGSGTQKLLFLFAGLYATRLTVGQFASVTDFTASAFDVTSFYDKH